MASLDPEEQPRAFVTRVGNALLRVVALFVLGGAHKLLSFGLPYVVPGNFPRSSVVFLEDVSFVIFALIYAYLLWDMLTVFVPKLRGLL